MWVGIKCEGKDVKLRARARAGVDEMKDSQPASGRVRLDPGKLQEGFGLVSRSTANTPVEKVASHSSLRLLISVPPGRKPFF